MKVREASDELIAKYSLYAKDFIEYPAKEFWTTDVQPRHFGYSAIANLAKSRAPTVLYLHMPYCPQMCFFCLCHFDITHNYDQVRRAVTYLKREIAHLSEQDAPNFKEIHFGGGSPTYIREQEFEELMFDARLLANEPDEISIEIDPRRVGTDRLHFYADLGVDRLSFGIQEFNREVQEQINRVQPPELIENLLTVRRRFKSINFDMLIGLPKQTSGSVERTMTRLIELAPDRVALSYMHYNPGVHKHQTAMTRNDGWLPSFRARKEMHEIAVEMLEHSGYVRTGMEHFAKPTDEVAKAVKEGKAQYNSLGATAGRCDWLVGLGESAYSRLGPYHYTQNFYERDKYEAAVDDKNIRLPIWRGHWLTGQDLIRRDIIQKIRIDFELDLAPINEKYHIDAGNMMMREVAAFDVMEADGLLVQGKDGKGRLSCLHLTDFGKNFANVVCRVFDRYVWDGQSVDEFFAGKRVEL